MLNLPTDVLSVIAELNDAACWVIWLNHHPYRKRFRPTFFRDIFITYKKTYQCSETKVFGELQSIDDRPSVIIMDPSGQVEMVMWHHRGELHREAGGPTRIDLSRGCLYGMS